jgi:hypothetical protein
LFFHGIREYYKKKIRVFLYFSCGFALLAFSDMLQIACRVPTDVLANRILALMRLSLYAGFVFLGVVALKKVEKTSEQNAS